MTDTVTAKLAEWEALAEGATEGPWVVDEDPPAMRYILASRNGGFDGTLVTQMPYSWDHPTTPDAEFIAAARHMVPALLAFVREVRAGHVREPYVDEPSEGFCRDCQRGGAAGTWPCPTEQAAQKWLGGEE